MKSRISNAVLGLFLSVVGASNAFAQSAVPSPGVTLNSEQQAQVNAIARGIFEKMKADSGGDPEKMQALMKAYMANPSAFFQSMNADEKKKVESLTQSVKKTTVVKPSPAM